MMTNGSGAVRRNSRYFKTNRGGN